MWFKSCKFVQQVFVVLQTLGSRASYDRSNGPPLSGHQLGQMKQLLLLLSGPFCFLDAGVQPLVPDDRNNRPQFSSSFPKISILWEFNEGVPEYRPVIKDNFYKFLDSFTRVSLLYKSQMFVLKLTIWLCTVWQTFGEAGKRYETTGFSHISSPLPWGSHPG